MKSSANWQIKKLQVQEPEQSLNKKNQQKSMSRHIIVKLLNTKDKEKTLKGAR